MTGDDPFSGPRQRRQQQRRQKDAAKRARERARMQQGPPTGAAGSAAGGGAGAHPDNASRQPSDTGAPWHESTAWQQDPPGGNPPGWQTTGDTGTPQGRTSRTFRYLTGLLVAATAVAVGAIAGTPTLSGQWTWTWLAGGGAVAAGALWLAWRNFPTSGRWRWIAASVTGAVCLFAGWGAVSTVVISGQPYLAFSQPAQVYITGNEMLADLQYIAQVDETLLAVDPVTARSRFDQYTPARDRLLGISDKWTDRLAEGDLPADVLRGAAEATRAAAYWAAQGVDAKSQWVVSTDAKLEATVVSYRTTVVENVIVAGQQLREATALFGIELVPEQNQGPVE